MYALDDVKNLVDINDISDLIFDLWPLFLDLFLWIFIKMLINENSLFPYTIHQSKIKSIFENLFSFDVESNR